MNYASKSIAVLMLAILVTGCAHHGNDKESTPHNNNFDSTLWVQSSAEFVANSLQTYNTATINLEAAVKTVTETAALVQTDRYSSLPPAVILDIDETVLDNSQYHAKLVLEGEEHSFVTWDQWVSLQQATAIPGAVNFIKHAKSIGVEVIYVTNRRCKAREGTLGKCPQKYDTIENLEQVGIIDVNPSHVLLKNEQQGWSSEKESRRKFVAEKYRIVMLLGDDLGDFLANVKKDITPEQREQLVAEHSEKWGSTWYILSNPKYGSWLRILEEPQSQYLRGY